MSKSKEQQTNLSDKLKKDAALHSHVNYHPKEITQLHGPSMLAVKAKIYGVLYKQSSSIAFEETSSHWSALKNT